MGTQILQKSMFGKLQLLSSNVREDLSPSLKQTFNIEQ